MTYITDFAYSSGSSMPYSEYVNANSPRILIDNLANKENIYNLSSEYTLPSNPEWLTAIPSTADKWKASNSYIYPWGALFGSYRIVNSFGICAHKGIVGKQMTFSLRKDGVFVKLMGPFIVTSEKPIFKVFDDVECDAAFLTFTNPAGDDFDIEIGVIMVGKSVALPRNIYVGHTPITYGRRPISRFVTSDNGNFLGQSSLSVMLESSVTMDNVPPDYYRDILYPYFQLPAETKPFFWAWRPQTYPNETGYAWIPDGRINPRNSKANGFMSISFSMQGYVSNGE